jgi:3-phenylpropionate/trans-cinnamate dioxygenase ferredoxin subunit
MALEDRIREAPPAPAARWTALMNEASLPEGGLKVAYPRGLNVVVARVDGAVYAVSGACPHMGCPLFTGSLTGGVLTCPCHDWRFDVRTGRFLSSPELGLTVYPVRSEAGVLFVNLEEGSRR